jgi:hypothetical protein
MSARIGEVKGLLVSASLGSVEVIIDIVTSYRSLTPIEARNLAALLVRASDEVDRMRDSADSANEVGALVEALRWCSGADDFQEGGKAHEGFERYVRPLLNNFGNRRQR